MGDDEDQNNDPNKLTLAKQFAMGLGSLVGANAAGAPLSEVAAPTETPAPPPVPAAPMPDQPKAPPQQSPGMSDNFKMGLIPLLTTLVGGFAGGNKGAMMGASSGLSSVGNEVQKQEQRAVLQQQKELQDKRDIAKAIEIDNAKNENRKALAVSKDELKPDKEEKPPRFGHYLDAAGKYMRNGPVDENGDPVDATKGSIVGPAPKDASAVLDEKDARDEKKHTQKVYSDLSAASSKPRGRTDVQQALVGNANIKKVLDIYDNAPNGDLNNITSQQAAIANQEIAKIAAGGVGSEHGVQAQAANTLVQKWQDFKSHLTGEPTPADIGGFLKLNQRYVEDMYKTNAETVHNYHKELYGNVAHELDPKDDAAFVKTHPWVQDDYTETPSGMVRMKDPDGVEHFVPRLNASKAKSQFKWKKVTE